MVHVYNLARSLISCLMCGRLLTSHLLPPRFVSLCLSRSFKRLHELFLLRFHVFYHGREAFIFLLPDLDWHIEGKDKWLCEMDLIEVLVWVAIKRIWIVSFRVFVIALMAATHAKLGEMTFRLQRALVDGTVYKTQAEHGCASVVAMEDALNFTIKFEEVILAEVHMFVLNLQCFLDTFLKINDDLICSLRLNILIDVAVGADRLKFN